MAIRARHSANQLHRTADFARQFGFGKYLPRADRTVRLFTRQKLTKADNQMRSYSFFIWAEAVRAMSFLVPFSSKATSSRASLPILATVRIMPRPKEVWTTVSPGL